MKVAVDTNVLLRLILRDDPVQHKIAESTFDQAEIVAVSNHALCEVAWVLRSRYGVSRENIAASIRQICKTANIVVDGGAVDAGFAAMDGGADFADGVIAYEGRWLGGETFVSFDKKAVEALAKQGIKAKLLG